MKRTYSVCVFVPGTDISKDFYVSAKNLKEAKKHAQSHKRLERMKGRTVVRVVSSNSNMF